MREIKLQMTGKQAVDIEVTEQEMGYSLIGYVQEKWLEPDFDDAGCDWMTHDGKVYIGGLHWLAVDNVLAAHLIDAANTLINGSPINAYDQDHRMGMDAALALAAKKADEEAAR